MTDHDLADPPAGSPPPLAPALPAPARSPAEEARTLVAAHRTASLATLSADGAPWASMVTYGALADGAPVLWVSTLAEHGRNLRDDPRASLVIAADPGDGDPLDTSRVTLAGKALVPAGDAADAARAAHVAAMPHVAPLESFGDFSLWVLVVQRVRWVGGYGRMASADAHAYATAEPDPVEAVAVRAREHLNDDHGDALLAMAQTLAGYPDATAARCVRADRYGLDLSVDTPRGTAAARVGFVARVERAEDLRGATVELARRSRSHASGDRRANPPSPGLRAPDLGRP